MIMAGASPNEIASTRESSSTPKRLPVPVARAMRPSKLSHTPPSTTYSTACANCPREAETMAKMPKNRLPSVKPLGRAGAARRTSDRRSRRATAPRTGFTSSPALRRRRWSSRGQIRQHRHARAHAFPHSHADRGAGRHEHVDPRPEADDAHAIALHDRHVETTIVDNPPRDQAGNLTHQHARPGRELDANR